MPPLSFDVRRSTRRQSTLPAGEGACPSIDTTFDTTFLRGCSVFGPPNGSLAHAPRGGARRGPTEPKRPGGADYPQISSAGVGLVHVVLAAVADLPLSSFGFSAMSASLVSSSVATLAALPSAVRTTFVGSITPALTRSS